MQQKYFESITLPGPVVITPQLNVAVVLAGCGARDGAEITEATSLLVNLSAQGFRVSIFAPDRFAAHTVNHLSLESETPGRSILEEAARIARGKIQPLSALKSADFHALAFAGGFGVAKNLCDYAFSGVEASLHADIKHVLVDFSKNRKPIAALCIAPILIGLLARELQIKGGHLTMGDGVTPSSAAAAAALHAWGVNHVAAQVRTAIIDSVNLWVSAPAYMHENASPADVFDSAAALVQGLRTLLHRN